MKHSHTIVPKKERAHSYRFVKKHCNIRDTWSSNYQRIMRPAWKRNIFAKVWRNALSISHTSHRDVIAGDNPDRAIQQYDMQSQIFMQPSGDSTELQSAGLNCNRLLICSPWSRSIESVGLLSEDGLHLNLVCLLYRALHHAHRCNPSRLRFFINKH